MKHIKKFGNEGISPGALILVSPMMVVKEVESHEEESRPTRETKKSGFKDKKTKINDRIKQNLVYRNTNNWGSSFSNRNTTGNEK